MTFRRPHPLVDARPILGEGVLEPPFQGSWETGGVYFRLYDFGDHEISVAETATDRVVGGRSSGRVDRSVVIETGYASVTHRPAGEVGSERRGCDEPADGLQRQDLPYGSHATGKTLW
ncbi:hypothetical protein [Methylobacterium aquaticum]|uniref:hypothetical protein n=1 Tax=Methylobacterium aquaticum TaxID=270351 RepID=UPI0012E29D59|nr:hypothetical protein [Methylobacterium aquaticum]